MCKEFFLPACLISFQHLSIYWSLGGILRVTRFALGVMLFVHWGVVSRLGAHYWKDTRIFP